MMKFGLRAKYTFFLAIMALSVSIVIGSVFILLMSSTVKKISASRSDVAKAAHELEMRERGTDIARLVSASLVAPLGSGQSQAISNVMSVALALENVEGIAVYDINARLLQGRVKSNEPLGERASAEIRGKVLGLGQRLMITSGNLVVISLPIRQGDRIFGALSLTLRDDRMISGVDRMYQGMNSLWNAERSRIVGAIVLMVVLFLLSNIAIAAYAARRISAPIRDLAAAARRIGEGRYDISLPLSNNDEFGDLASALGRMSTDLKKSTVSVNYLDDIIGNMSEGLIVADHSGLIEKVNRTACELSGYTEDELIGQNVEMLAANENPDARKALTNDLSFSLAAELKARDGHRVPVLLSHAMMKSQISGAPGRIYVFNDISGIKQREDELGAARDEAQVANRAKSQFLATMSHELRTPLNAIIGFSSMLKDQIGGPLSEKYQSYALDIYESADHLLMIINDLLDISKLEAGKMELTEEPVELSEVVHSAIRLVREKARTKGITISSIGIDAVPAIYGDRRMAKQMVTNLLSNAYKFNVDGGSITVEAFSDPATGLDLKVTDTGIGIAVEDMARVALPFSQVENHISRNFQGTGLGLAITKSMMELHGGNLLIDSEKGKGTSVTLHFPPSRIEAS